MPGDPLRARFIADRFFFFFFLKNVQLVNDVRNMLGYTGEYNGKMVTVMGTGMGAASTESMPTNLSITMGKTADQSGFNRLHSITCKCQ